MVQGAEQPHGGSRDSAGAAGDAWPQGGGGWGEVINTAKGPRQGALQRMEAGGWSPACCPRHWVMHCILT